MKTREQIHTIIVEYRDNHARAADLAVTFGMTRQGIYKLLRAHGVDISKAQKVKRTCRVCGVPLLRRRAVARKTQHSYCSPTCYTTYLETLGENYRPSNYHSRVARRIVKEAWPDYNPEAGHTIHHIDKDCEHNNLKNLEVYTSQSDHLKKHRGQDVKPIWKGAPGVSPFSFG